MQRFLAERYDADNKLLRPQQHYSKCPACRAGGDCGRRPPPVPVHDSDDMRRECYRLQKSAYEDVYSRGRVTLWEDYEGVDESGTVTAGAKGRGKRAAEMRPRTEAGDCTDSAGAMFAVNPLFPPRRKK